MTPALRDSSSTLNRLLNHEQVTSREAAIFKAAGAHTTEAMLSLLSNFPTLTQDGLIDGPKVSNALYRHDGRGARLFYMRLALGYANQSKGPGEPQTLGAKPPPQAKWLPGESVPVPRPTTATALSSEFASSPTTEVIDTRRCLPWPVRNQAGRGTCVAFAVTALREALACEEGDPRDLSEQFLYWAIKIKVGDPFPTEDGTYIENAIKALAKFGVCDESQSAYNPNFIPNDPGQNVSPHLPSAAAQAAALTRAHKAATYSGSGKAAKLRQALAKGRPVAVSLPVFSDPLAPNYLHNWNTPVGTYYGEVLDPPPTSVVSGGHAVCLTGFVPDHNEPKGGYFIIRNSWGTQWGSDLPAAGHHGPQAGYGQVSASYVDKYLWEWAQL